VQKHKVNAVSVQHKISQVISLHHSKMHLLFTVESCGKGRLLTKNKHAGLISKTEKYLSFGGKCFFRFFKVLVYKKMPDTKSQPIRIPQTTLPITLFSASLAKLKSHQIYSMI